MPTNIYEKQNRFRLEDIDGVLLEDAGDWIQIFEPDKFKEINIKIKRDKVTHGVMWEYSDEEIALMWDYVRYLDPINYIPRDERNDFSVIGGGWTHVDVATYTADNDGEADRIEITTALGYIQKAFTGLTAGDIATIEVFVKDIASVDDLLVSVRDSLDVQLNVVTPSIAGEDTYQKINLSCTVPGDGEIRLRIGWNGAAVDFDIKELGIFENYYSPRSFLQFLYNLDGTNAKCFLYFEHYNGAQWVTDYQGRINFNKYGRAESKLSIPVKRMDFDDKFRTRSNTKVWAKQEVDFDGVNHVNSDPPELDLWTHSRSYEQELDVHGLVGASVDGENYSKAEMIPATDGSEIGFLIGFTAEGNKLDLNHYLSYGTQTQVDPDGDQTTALTSQYYKQGFNILDAEYDGEYDVTTIGDITFTYAGISGGSHSWAQNIFLVKVSASGTEEFEIGAGASGSGSGPTFNNTYVFNEVNTFNLQANDKLFLIGRALVVDNLNFGTISIEVDINSSNLNIEALTTSIPTVVKSYKLREVMEHAIHMMTGEDDALESSELDGCLNGMLITNGKQLRGLVYDSGDSDTFNIPPKYSWERLYLDAKALFGLGLQVYNKDDQYYRLDGNGDYYTIPSNISEFNDAVVPVVVVINTSASQGIIFSDGTSYAIAWEDSSALGMGTGVSNLFVDDVDKSSADRDELHDLIADGIDHKIAFDLNMTLFVATSFVMNNYTTTSYNAIVGYKRTQIGDKLWDGQGRGKYGVQDMTVTGTPTLLGDDPALKALVERYSFFYRTEPENLILTIDETYDFEMKTEASEMYNKIKVGYKKFMDGDEVFKANTLDQFNTEHQYLTYLETIKNTWESICEMIADGYPIEATRRAIETDESWKYDDDLFIMSSEETNRYPTTQNISLLNDGGTYYVIFAERIPQLAEAGVDNMDVNAVNDGSSPRSFTIENVELSQFQTKVRVTESVSTSSFNHDVGDYVDLFVGLADYDFWRPETNRKFTGVTGIIDPNSAYNLRLNPKSMFLNQVPIMNSGMFYSGGVGEYQNTFVSNNENLDLQFKDGENCSTLDPQRVSWKMGENIDFLNIDYENTLYRPERVEFKCRLSYTQILIIRDCMMNEHLDDDKNRGYLLVPDDEGAFWIVLIDELNYNPMSEETMIKGKIHTEDFSLNTFTVRTMENNDYRLLEDGSYRLI